MHIEADVSIRLEEVACSLPSQWSGLLSFLKTYPTIDTAIRMLESTGWDVAYRVNLLCGVLGGLAASGLFRAILVGSCPYC